MTDVLGFLSWPLLLVGAYVIGSIPSAQLLARLKGIDLTQEGTGNVGAGNLTALAGKPWGIAAAILDGLKGLAPVLFARFVLDLGIASSGIAGLAAVVGHCWSIFMRGRSGRGLATSAGLMIALDPVLMVWITGWSVAGWRIGGGFAGFLGWGLLPLFALALGRPGTEVLFLLLLTSVLLGRRAQGNADALGGASNFLRRAIYDSDAEEGGDYREPADEATTS